MFAFSTREGQEKREIERKKAHTQRNYLTTKYWSHKCNCKLVKIWDMRKKGGSNYKWHEVKVCACMINEKQYEKETTTKMMYLQTWGENEVRNVHLFMIPTMIFCSLCNIRFRQNSKTIRNCFCLQNNRITLTWPREHQIPIDKRWWWWWFLLEGLSLWGRTVGSCSTRLLKFVDFSFKKKV